MLCSLRARLPFVIGSLGILAQACSSTSGSAESIHQITQPIIGGIESDASQDSVVLLVHPISDSENLECTATLIAPSLLLTARHCVSETVDTSFECYSDGGGTDSAVIKADFEPASLYIYAGNTHGHLSPLAAHARGKVIVHDNASKICNHDIALVVLERPILNDDGRPIFSPIRLNSLPTAGEPITIVGWGATTSTASPTTRQQRLGLHVDVLGPYDDPNHEFAIPPNEFLVGESTCNGDSGGPAFDADTKAVVEVVSHGGNGHEPNPNDPSLVCRNALNFYTELAPFKTVILKAFGIAKEQPWLEGASSPAAVSLDPVAIGQSCLIDSDCVGNVCIRDVDSNGVCSQACSSELPCPTGFSCDFANDSVCHSATHGEGQMLGPKKPYVQRCEFQGVLGNRANTRLSNAEYAIVFLVIACASWRRRSRTQGS